jgi:hypothetical protein
MAKLEVQRHKKRSKKQQIGKYKEGIIRSTKTTKWEVKSDKMRWIKDDISCTVFDSPRAGSYLARARASRSAGGLGRTGSRPPTLKRHLFSNYFLSAYHLIFFCVNVSQY